MNITNALPNSQTHNFTINNFVIEKQNATVFVTQDDINQVLDYYPYGKVLREYINGGQERYLTTQHERDQATGLDYRGARYYDADVARFLALDPLASEFPNWSVYTTLNVIIQADVSTEGYQRTFNGVDFIVNSEGITYASLGPFEQLDFITESVTFSGEDMELPKVRSYSPSTGSKTYTEHWNAQYISNNFNKSFNKTINITGQYTIGGNHLKHMTVFGQALMNATQVSLTLPFQNR